ncbi:MAG: hypothetical protein AABZ06_09700 [Bdellovibrionota bacterium]
MASRINQEVLNKLIRAAVFLGCYAAWIFAVRVISLSLVTYLQISSSARFFLSSDPARLPRFEEIGETFAAHETTIMGFASLLFLFLLPLFNPITSTTVTEIFPRQEIKKNFLPGFAKGFVFGCAILAGFAAAGTHRYLGYYMQLEETPWAIVGVLIKTAAILLLAYCEEYIFRHKIMRYFLPHTYSNLVMSLLASCIIAMAYCGIKLIQFDLGVMQLVTLFLLSLSFSINAFMTGDPANIGSTTTSYINGAGVFAGLLVLFNSLLSLPVFSEEFSGAFVFKFQADAVSDYSFLTGGAAGPFAGTLFQLILLVHVLRSTIRYKKGIKICLK